MFNLYFSKLVDAHKCREASKGKQSNLHCHKCKQPAAKKTSKNKRLATAAKEQQ